MELRLPTPVQLEVVYKTDLQEAFPPAELKPLRAIQEMWRDGWYRPWCLFDGEEVAGVCFLWLGKPGWALLDYLCVPSRRRNGGIGAILLEEMRRKEPNTVILGECEAPQHAPDPPMAERRLGFYARNGARMAGYDTDVFGIHYKTIYWAEKPVCDEALMEQHRFIYQNRFAPDKYQQYVRIPRDPAAGPFPQVPWEE